MVAEEVVITLAGGAPWGFRLQGGLEHQRPLQVAKVRKRSKACRAGLREADELVSINEEACGALSHAQAMALIDSSLGMLHIRVRRAPAGFQSVVLLTRAPSPRIDKEYRAALRAMSPSSSRPHHHSSHSRSCLLSPTGRSGLTSPPGSEAYYGETDSDADVAAHERQRRQKRRSPSSSAPGGKPAGRTSPEGGETSEMSGYDSAPDARGYPGAPDGGGCGGGGEGLLPGAGGVARREVIYQPPGMWSSQTSTETSSIISSADDQGPPGGGAEEDSGFLEPSNVPMVSPHRAKEAMMLASHSQLVPMVGPVGQPVDEELSTTYMDKAKQAKLNRGDTVQDKQVKEARTKCRTIANLLTDAPNPHSKGVLMFKKRRQRSKKYTLTSFGSVDEDLQQDSQEEDGIFPGSESEFDEDGFSAAPDPTWDSDYLDMLEKRATAAGGGRGDGADDAPSPGLSDTAGKGAQLFEQQRKRAAEHARKVEAHQPQVPPQPQNQAHVKDQSQLYLQSQSQPGTQPLQMQPNAQPQPTMPPPPAAFQEEARPVGPPPDMAPLSNGEVAYSGVRAASMAFGVLSSVPASPQTPLPELSSSSVLNRTARPFAPGFVSNRAATAPVVFRPAVAKKPQRPATSVSMVPPPYSSSSDLAAHTPLFTSSMSQLSPSGYAPIFSPPSSESGGPVCLPTPYLPAFSTLVESPQQATQPIAVAQIPQVPVSMASMPPAPAAFAKQPPMYVAQPPPMPAAPAPTTPVSVEYHPAPAAAPMLLASSPMSPPGGRTGILQDAWRRSGARPMFRTPEEKKKNSPNPELLNMVQNLDERPRRAHGWPPYEDDEEDVGGSEGVDRGRMAPPVAPKPRVIHEGPQIPKAEGKGAQLFARRQSRMDHYVVDTPPETPFQQEMPHPAFGVQPCDFYTNPSIPSQWKYSPNIRAPPPIGYNPLLAPTCPVGPQRDPGRFDRGRGAVGSQKEGIKAVDVMRRQPYQLNSAMFSYGGSTANLSAMPSYQAQRQQQYSGYTMVGSSLTPPKQIPIKAARVYEIKRFSTPTPMSAPTLATKVIAPRSATTLGEPMMRSDMISPDPIQVTPPSTPAFATTSTPFNAPTPTAALPSLPKLSATPIPNSIPIPHPVPYTGAPYPGPSYAGASYTGLQAAKQFQSAPELSFMASLPPLRPTNIIQVPKPRFIANRSGIKSHVWRPGAM